MAKPRYARFEPETLKFLEELAANNNREWFKENKSRYEEQVLDVALRFIDSMHDPLHDIAPHFVAQATRVGGSLMRVYRDTRFSKDKTPYNSHLHISFTPESGLSSPPAWMFGLSTEYFTLGCGVFEFDKTAGVRENTLAIAKQTWIRSVASTDMSPSSRVICSISSSVNSYAFVFARLQ